MIEIFCHGRPTMAHPVEYHLHEPKYEGLLTVDPAPSQFYLTNTILTFFVSYVLLSRNSKDNGV
jgi:hypothetical protein